jgi:hypothetical protein
VLDDRYIDKRCCNPAQTLLSKLNEACLVCEEAQKDLERSQRFDCQMAPKGQVRRALRGQLEALSAVTT